MLNLTDRLEKNDMKVWARGNEKCEGSKGTALLNSKVEYYSCDTAQQNQGWEGGLGARGGESD